MDEKRKNAIYFYKQVLLEKRSELVDIINNYISSEPESVRPVLIDAANDILIKIDKIIQG